MSHNPVTQTSRIAEIDILRGFAVLGIFWVNIIYFGYPYSANSFPTLLGSADELNALFWAIGNLFVEGSMFALFSMLFGASALIILDEKKLASADGVKAVDRYYRRTLWLVGFGLIHAFILLWPLEILFTYGVLGLVLFPLRNMRPAALLIVGVLLVAFGTLDLGDDEEENTNSGEPSIELESAKSAIEDSAYREIVLQFRENLLDEIQVEIDLYKSGYIKIFKTSLDSAALQQSTNLYEDNIYDAGGMMLIGMALMKWGVLSGLRSSGFYLLMMLLGYACSLALRGPIVEEIVTSNFDPYACLGVSNSSYLLARLSLALGHIGTVMLLSRAGWFRFPARALSAAGRMALTNYIAQTLFAIFLFYGFGFALYGDMEYYQLILTSIAFGLFQIIYSLWWLKRYRFGPLEWLWRSLVQQRKQPMRNHPLPIPSLSEEPGKG